jgi:hypothetical protein
LELIGSGRRADLCVRHHKLTFTTENEAKLQLVRAAALHEQQGKPKVECRFYACELGGFHLTSWADKATPMGQGR